MSDHRGSDHDDEAGTVPPRWSKSPAEIANNHTQVSGVLAGFTITIFVLVIDPHGDGVSRLRDAASGLFLASFFSFVATGVLFSMVGERKLAHANALFVSASAMYFLSVLLSFAALLPLLNLFELPTARRIAGAMVVITALGGCMAAITPILDLFDEKVRTVALLLGAAMITAILFGAVLAILDGIKLLLLIAPYVGLASTTVVFFAAAASFMLPFRTRGWTAIWIARAAVLVCATGVVFISLAVLFSR